MTSSSAELNRTGIGRRILRRIMQIDRGLLVLIVAFIVLLPVVTPRIYGSDEIQYFSYLHSYWFDRDVDFYNQYMHFYESDPGKYAQFKEDLIDKREPATGLPLNVAPIGSAVMWAPFFAMGDIAAHVMQWFGSDVKTDGFSQPYITAVTYGSAIYGFLGLLLTWGLCRKLFSRFSSGLGTLAIWMATPAFFYMYITPPMSHANSLFAVALFVFIWYHTREDRKAWQWALLGVSASLMVLVREQDGLFLLIPAVEWLFGIVRSLRARENIYLPGRIGGPVLMVAVLGLLFVPQLLTYINLTGHLGPSGHVSGKLLWNSPFFFSVLASPEHGMFFWSPVILLSFIGFIWLFRKDPELAIVLLVAVIAQVYIAGAFKTWSVAGAFGARRFVNCTVIFALGLTALIDALDKRVPRWSLGALGGVFILWNFGMIMQYGSGMMNRQALDWPKILHNQFFEVPQKAWAVIERFLVDRSSFYQKGK